MQGNTPGYFRHHVGLRCQKSGIFKPKKGNSRPWCGTPLIGTQAKLQRDLSGVTSPDDCYGNRGAFAREFVALVIGFH